MKLSTITSNTCASLLQSWCSELPNRPFLKANARLVVSSQSSDVHGAITWICHSVTCIRTCCREIFIGFFWQTEILFHEFWKLCMAASELSRHDESNDPWMCLQYLASSFLRIRSFYILSHFVFTSAKEYLIRSFSPNKYATPSAIMNGGRAQLSNHLEANRCTFGAKFRRWSR